MIEYDTLKYTKIEVSNDLLLDFEEEGFTYLHCTCYASKKYLIGWWVNIEKESYLVGEQSSIKLKMLNAIDIPISPQKHYLKNRTDTLKFTLIFPAIPKDWKTFDFIEDTKPTRQKSTTIPNFDDVSEGLVIRNIPRNKTGVYKVIIQ